MAGRRIAAVDYGTARIGIALSDPMRIIASPLGTFQEDLALHELEKLVKESDVETIVLGLPLELSGVEGKSVEMVRRFKKKIRLRLPDVAIVEWDERFTSIMAKRAVLDSGIGKMKRRERGRVDRVAASILLQSYIDAGCPPAAPETSD